jgi:protein-S-isoprenylcysteine O-methyltransferase Ste14
MNNAHGSKGGLIKTVSVRWLGFVIVLVALFFLPAGTFDYWEAWVYMLVLLVPAVVVLFYLLRKDPALVERRMRTREREALQRLVVLLSYLWFVLVFLIPGFDRRFGWSDVPLGVVIAADVLVFVGYLIVFLVLRENSYASRVVDVEREQKVVSTGPYSVVRHPMYMGVIVMYLMTPLALGSYWALIPAPLIIPILVARIRNEEQVLAKELPGYSGYMQKVIYRLIPGIW